MRLFQRCVLRAAALFLLCAVLPGLWWAPRPSVALAAATGTGEEHETKVQGGYVSPSGAFHAEPPAKPTSVKAGIYLVGVKKISPPDEPFPFYEAELLLDFKWKDPRLAFDPAEAGTEKIVFQEEAARKRLARMWHPDVGIENEQSKRVAEAQELTITKDGEVEYFERCSATLHAELDLRNFPFDAQTFTVELESFAWDERYVKLEPLPEKTGFNESFHTLEWRFDGVQVKTRSKKEVRSPVEFSQVVLFIQATRDPGYYLWKIVAPLMLIIVLTWTTFFMKGESSDVRMERNYIALLTVVAFQAVVSSYLPRISYVTFMDGMVYVAFGVVGLTMIFMIITQRLAYEGRHELVERLDFHARWAFPTLLLVALTVLWIFYHLDHGGHGHA